MPVKHTEGFNPHLRFSIGAPLSLGISSDGEYMDVDLERKVSIDEFIKSMNKVLPEDIRIICGKYVEDKPSLSSVIQWSYYKIEFKIKEELTEDEIKKLIKDYLNCDSIEFVKERKKKGRLQQKIENIRPQVGNIVLKNKEDRIIVLDVLLKTSENGNLKPKDFLSSFIDFYHLSLDDYCVNIHRIDMYGEKENSIFNII